MEDRQSRPVTGPMDVQAERLRELAQDVPDEPQAGEDFWESCYRVEYVR